MTANRWSDEQQRAYRSFITIGRIADECQVVGLVVGLPLALWLVPGRIEWASLAAFASISALAQFGIPLILPRLLPRHMRSRLVRGRFDAVGVAEAPHTYGDLVRMWSDPTWRCRHGYEPIASPAPVQASILYIAAMLATSAITVSAQVQFAPRTTGVVIIGIGVVGAMVTIGAARRFGSYVSGARFTSPPAGERVAVAVVALLVIASSTAINACRAAA